jgi:hypothetical protein
MNPAIYRSNVLIINQNLGIIDLMFVGLIVPKSDRFNYEIKYW